MTLTSYLRAQMKLGGVLWCKVRVFILANKDDRLNRRHPEHFRTRETTNGLFFPTDFAIIPVGQYTGRTF